MSCEHCINEKSFYRAEDHGMTADIRVCGNMLIADLYSDYAQFPIKFCPNCGEPLTEPVPLTLERLREMDGYPIWIKSTTSKKYCKGAVNYPEFDYATNNDFIFNYSDYNAEWLAYARPPKEQDA